MIRTTCTVGLSPLKPNPKIVSFATRAQADRLGCIEMIRAVAVLHAVMTTFARRARFRGCGSPRRSRERVRSTDHRRGCPRMETFEQPIICDNGQQRVYRTSGG